MARHKSPATAKELKPAPYNPRTITQEGLASLERSMLKYGDLSGIVFNRRSGRLIGGHQRLKAIPKDAHITITQRFDKPTKQRTVAHGTLDLDGELWAYREVDGDEAWEKGANISANLQRARFDEDLLRPIVADLQKAGEDLGTIGFTAKDLTRIFTQKADEGPQGPASGTKPAKPTSRPGRIYVLGSHRLLCGDATDAGLVQALLDGELAELVYTDPPDGVDYQARSGKHEKIEGDALKRDNLRKLLVALFKNAARNAQAKAAFYIWHASATRRIYDDALLAAGLEERQYLIWAKPQMTMGWGDYRCSHEPLYYAGRAGHEPAFYGDRAQSTVWRTATAEGGSTAAAIGPGLLITDGDGHEVYITTKIPKRKLRSLTIPQGGTLELSPNVDDLTLWEVTQESNPEHPNQKPLALAHRAIANSTKVGERVLDLCAGSGNTLLAAQLTGRRAFVAEIDPGYCDIIRRRYEELTAK